MMKENGVSTKELLLGSIMIAIVAILGFFILLRDYETVTLPLKIEEYADFQCPACGVYYPVVKAIREKYGDKINYQFVHFPLENIHEYAYQASIASEAARLQGKFEEYYSKLFENQENLTAADLEQYATELNLDLVKFKADMQSQEVKAVIENDLLKGEKKYISGTPTFYVNGRKVNFISKNDAQSLEELQQDLIQQFSALIDAKLAKAK